MTTDIVEYSKTEAALADLARRYKDVVFDVTTRDGMATAIKITSTRWMISGTGLT